MIVQALIRGGIPFVIMTAISISVYFDSEQNDAMGIFLAGLIFTVVSAASVIYDLDHLSILQRSLIHFAAMLVTIYPILIISGWFNTSTFMDYVVIFIVFLFTGIAIWSIVMGVRKLLSKS